MGSCVSTTQQQPHVSSQALQAVPRSHSLYNAKLLSQQSVHEISSQPTWLDLLPKHACFRIAHFISNGKPCLDALRLAETSNFQCVAILQALSYTFSSECLDNDLESRWSRVFMDHVQEVSITSGFYDGCIPLLKLLKADTLQRVTLFGENGVMRALAESASVRELTLSVTSETAFETLNEMLYRLNLTRLSLVCTSFYDEEDCAFFPLADPRCLCDFADACKKLSYLVVDCDHEFPEHPTWTLLRATPSVEKTTLNVDPPKDLIPRLQSFTSVEIGSNVTDWKHLVRELGPAVTLLETYCVTDHPSLAKEEADFSKLAHCPNLSDLDICIQNGVEDSLLKVIPKFKSLRRLALRWVFALTGENVMEYSNPLYHAPAQGLITCVVQTCPDLDKLCLRCVRICTKEQDDVMRTIGNRLLEIELSFNGQTEHTFDRIESFLRSAISYNHSLRKIGLVEEERIVRLCEEGEEPNKEAIERQRSRLFQLLSVLRRRAPNLDDSNIHEFITGMEIPEAPES